MAVKNIHFTPLEISLVKYIFKHYQDKFNARQLAKLLHLNHAHVNKLCYLLVHKDLLIKERLGNSAYFSYDYKSTLATNFMGYLLSLEEKEFPQYLGILLHSLKKFNPLIQAGLVFGSAIRTEDCHDFDVLLMYKTEKSKEIKKIKEGIRKSELLEKPVRYVDITEKDILANAKDKTFYNILSESLIFHNPEKYVEVVRKCRKSMSI